MYGHRNRSRLAAVATIAVLALVPGPVAAVEVASAGDASRLTATETLPGDTGTPFWPHETGVLVGTSETYADVREDGSYYDPSLGRRVALAEGAGDKIVVDDWFRDGLKVSAPRTSAGIVVDDWFRDGLEVTAPRTNAAIVDELALDRSTVSVARSNPDGFDWGDFGIGAAVMLGVTLVLGGCGLVVLTSRDRGGQLKAS